MLVLSACGGKKSAAEDNRTSQFGSTTFNDHGTKSAAKAGEIDLEADDFYFEPTFVSGNPGQKVTLKIENDSTTLHNFSVKSQNVDSDLQPKGDTQVTVTIPDSGVLLFFCKYHSGQGMNGELLSGNTAPGDPSASSVAPAGQSTSNDSTY
jgi:plastocyanin